MFNKTLGFIDRHILKAILIVWLGFFFWVVLHIEQIYDIR